MEQVGQKQYEEDDALVLRLTKSGDKCYYQTANVVVYKITGDGASASTPYSVPCDQMERVQWVAQTSTRGNGDVTMQDEVNGAYAPVNDAHYNMDAIVEFYK